MNLNKLTKAELIKRIEELEERIDFMYSDEQLNERYDQGYDAGYRYGQDHQLYNNDEEIDIEQYDNVLRFG